MAVPVPVLSSRALNRATLARQMLLERSAGGIAQAVALLCGLQAQQTHDPYIALWSRLQDFGHEDMTALINNRTLSRATTMRGTLHLHTADDLIGVRALVEPFLKAQWKGNFLRRFGNNNKAKVLRAAIKLIDSKPMTAGALGKLLKQTFPTADPLSMTTLLQSHETLVQIPPTRIWGSGHAPILTRLENWLPPPHQRPLSRETLVRRYLAAFGPASVADMQSWCRLTRLNVEFKRIGKDLIELRGERDEVLYDLPDAPRPDPDTPAPVRFLPLYDNVYLGYHDRRRMLSPATVDYISLFRNFKPAVLIDGQINAGWSIVDARSSARLEIEPYRRLQKREIRELEREGEAFIRFMRPEADACDVAVHDPA